MPFSGDFGVLLDRRGLRFCIPLGVLGLGAGLLLLSFTRGEAMLFASFVLIRATAIGCIEAWTNAAIALWFSTHRGRAIALSC